MVMLFFIYICQVVIFIGIVLSNSLKKIVFLNEHTRENPVYFSPLIYFATRAVVPADVDGTSVSIVSDF